MNRSITMIQSNIYIISPDSSYDIKIPQSQPTKNRDWFCTRFLPLWKNKEEKHCVSTVWRPWNLQKHQSDIFLKRGVGAARKQCLKRGNWRLQLYKSDLDLQICCRKEGGYKMRKVYLFPRKTVVMTVFADLVEVRCCFPRRANLCLSARSTIPGKETQEILPAM